MTSPVFVVGTGRCGSTLVSTMLEAHPEVLSLSELFAFVTDLGGEIGEAFCERPLSGEQFWAIVAGHHPRANLLLRHDLRMDEVRYPFGRGRYTPQTGVPALAMTTLARVSDDPDALLDELASVATHRDEATIGAHYRALLEDLREREGRRIWVERSGGSLRVVHRLAATFPEARFLHLVRDGRNTALSMSRHIGFRMAMIHAALVELLGVDPFVDEDRSEVDDLPDDLAALLPEHFSRSAFEAYELAPALCGHYWSGEIREGLAVLQAMAPGRWINLRYEDLLERPRESVTRISEFLELGEAPAGWIDAAVAMVGDGRSRWQQLPEAERRELDEACRPGFEALAALGLTW